MFAERNGKKDLLGKKALVIGGSISGKLAARVLSDFFEEVIIVDTGPIFPCSIKRSAF